MSTPPPPPRTNFNDRLSSVDTVAKSATERALRPWSTPTVKIVNLSVATQSGPRPDPHSIEGSSYFIPS